MPPKAQALAPENALVLATGPLAGVPVIGGSRLFVCGKSPATSPEHFSYCNMGGDWAVRLKSAGYDLVFVQGKADKPVYLLIHDGKAELKDASALWGKGAIQAREMLTAELGGEISVVAIGPAGENQATMACLIASDDASGGAGMGAVMGSKNLKAIVVQGPRKRTKAAQPEKLEELTKHFRRIITPSPMATAGGVDLRIAVPQSRKAPCYGCMGDCLRWDYQSKDGQRGKFMCQSATFYQPMAEMVYGKDYEVPFRANKLCDEYGLDTMAVTLILIWLIRCLRDGILTDESTGIPISKVGSVEFIETLVRKIALREGFGDVLARGVEAAAASVGPAAVQKLTPVPGQGRPAQRPSMPGSIPWCGCRWPWSRSCPWATPTRSPAWCSDGFSGAAATRTATCPTRSSAASPGGTGAARPPATCPAPKAWPWPPRWCRTGSTPRTAWCCAASCGP